MKAPRIPLRSFFRNPASHSYRLSPDGKMISFLKPWNQCLNLFVRVGPHGRIKRITNETERDIDDYFWKGDGCLIYEQDSAANGGGFHLYRLDLQTGEAMDLTPFKNVRTDLVDDLEGISEDEILIQLMRNKRRVFDVHRLNVRTGRMKMVAQNPGSVWRWVTDNLGRVRAAISIDGLNFNLLTRPDGNSPFKLVRPMDFRYSIGWLPDSNSNQRLLAYTANNKGIYAISKIKKNRDTAALVIISSATGREISCLYENPHVDVASFAFSKKFRVVTYASFDLSKPQRKIFDRRTAAVFKALTQKLRGYVVKIIAQDEAEEKFIVIASNDRTPGKRYLFDAPKQRLVLLSEVAPWLKEKQLAPVRSVGFMSRDGLFIDGYLTLPLGRKPKKLPLVVNVHGGPENRDYWQAWQDSQDRQYTPPESAEVQFLANRGYAVFQVNFRGSIGYGRSFWEKGFKQRGRKMQHDVSDGVEWLIRRGIADPERIAIYGKSYGGYAALVGATFPPNLYKAAIDYAGVSNWLTWLDSIRNSPLVPQFYIKVGHPKEDRDWLEAVAPQLHADQINTPVFIAHGAQDLVVSRTESDRMVAALQRVDVEYMVRANEYHTFRSERNKIAFYKAMEAFLAKHLR